MKIVAACIALAVIAAPSFALAEQPADPGGFGRDRAAAIHAAQAEGTAPGASEIGKILSERGGENGTINNEYKCANGQVPSTASFCN